MTLKQFRFVFGLNGAIMGKWEGVEMNLAKDFRRFSTSEVYAELESVIHEFGDMPKLYYIKAVRSRIMERMHEQLKNSAIISPLTKDILTKWEKKHDRISPPSI